MSERLRTFLILGVCGVLGLLLGLGGATMALWTDSASGTGTISSGFEHFAAGRVGQTVPAENRTVTVSLGPAEAEKLLDDGEIAVALQTDSLSQGNRGLRYTITQPKWSGGVFGVSEVVLYKVPAAKECTVAGRPATIPADLSSTPVSADYSDTTTPTREFWCVSATLKNGGEVGEYANTATVTAKDSAGTEARSTATWNARVGLGIDPKQEPKHEITFTYSTFRPGGGTR